MRNIWKLKTEPWGLSAVRDELYSGDMRVACKCASESPKEKGQQNDTSAWSMAWEEGRKGKNHTVEMWVLFICTFHATPVYATTLDTRRSRWDCAVANVSSDQSAEVLSGYVTVEGKGWFKSTPLTDGGNARFRYQSGDEVSNCLVFLSIPRLMFRIFMDGAFI